MYINNKNIFFTAEGGIAIRMINKTGAPSVKGYLIVPSQTVDNGFVYQPADEADVCGIVYESGKADGELCLVVIQGKAEIYYNSATTTGLFARGQVTADGGTPGHVIAEAVPTSPFATDKHFLEVGHILQSIGGAGLALTLLHWN